MRKPLSNSLAIGLLLIAGSLLNMPQEALADPPTCAPFNDPGCFFGENWENGTTNGWALNVVGALDNVAPGLNGTAHTGQIHYGALASTSAWADTNVSHGTTDGDVIWLEFYLKYDSGFIFGLTPGGTPFFKMIEIDLENPAGCAGRLLMTALGQGPDYTTALPAWSPYPNYVGSCGANGTGAEQINSSFVLTGGVVYHVINEIKLATGHNGYIKTWYNGTLAMSMTGIQTVAQSGAGFQFIRIGGQGGNGTSGSENVQYDQIRITTTSISPLAQQAPVSPSSLTLK